MRKNALLMKKVLFYLLIAVAVLSCNQKSKEVTHEYTNALIDETSLPLVPRDGRGMF